MKQRLLVVAFVRAATAAMYLLRCPLSGLSTRMPTRREPLTAS